MPTPGAKHATYFKGKRVQDFLDDLETHDDSPFPLHMSPPVFVPRYCTLYDKGEELTCRGLWAKHDLVAAQPYLGKLYTTKSHCWKDTYLGLKVS